jgi:DNA-binding winged helix-turn-helix (wHTH) protein
VQIRFETFLLDLTRRQLTRDGEVLHLTPKAFDLLALLVDRAPAVVSKKELHEKLWPDSFVSDATLVSVVKEVRRTLGDRARSQPIIRTAHTVGYAFSLEVEKRLPIPSARTHWLLVNERRVMLEGGENIIGRDPAAIVWLDASSVSRRHARIIVGDDGARLEDLGSKNGTKVGDRLVTGETTLENGDVIVVGAIHLRYGTADTGATTDTRFTTGA